MEKDVNSIKNTFMCEKVKSTQKTVCKKDKEQTVLDRSGQKY